nr:MAG TPA: Concanavalin A-like lectin/glucanase superfamily protein [Caudoviricetes sp.]
MHAFRLGIIAAAARITAGGGGGGGAVDPMFEDVQLLLHGDTGTVLDSSLFGRTATVSGTITNSTAVSGYFGAAQLQFASGAAATFTGLKATTDGTHTFECFIRFPVDGSPRAHIFGSWSGSNGWTFDLDNGGGPQLAINGALASRSGGTGLNKNVRYHLALVLTISSSTTTAVCYVDGVQNCTFSAGVIGSRNSNDDIYSVRVGNRSDNSLNFEGFIDEFRYTRGARYTGAFTPPTAAFQDAGPALVFTAGTDITLTDGGRTAASTNGWTSTPITTPIPSTGKHYVEFLVNGAGAQMLGVMQSAAVTGNFVGAFSNSTSNGDDLRNGGGIFTTVTGGNFSSASSRVGVAVDQTAGRVRWYKDGVLQAAEVSFTPGTSGLYFAAGMNAARPSVSVLRGSANTPSGFTYLGA